MQTATVNECTTDGEGQPGCTQDGWIDVPWVVGCEGPCCVGQRQEYSLNKVAGTEIAQAQFDGGAADREAAGADAVTIGLAVAEGEKWCCAAACVKCMGHSQCTHAASTWTAWPEHCRHVGAAEVRFRRSSQHVRSGAQRGIADVAEGSCAWQDGTVAWQVVSGAVCYQPPALRRWAGSSHQNHAPPKFI